MTAAPLSVAIITDFVHNYQAHLLVGIREALNERGLASTVYVGRELFPPGHPVHDANAVYRLIRPDQHCGVILLTANLGRAVSGDDLMRFARQFAPLPVVSVGKKIAGVPSILVDSRPGMQALMEHLIVKRQFRRFVFVRGREGNDDSNDREQVFREALALHGLPFRSDWTLCGDYRAHAAYDAMRTLLATTRDFDVVVSANDQMTEGIIRALREHELRVPEDVAVVGFDDDEDFRHAIPPLTTVRQPVVEQGVAAVELLCSLDPRHDVHIDTQLVVRESCGTKGGSGPLSLAHEALPRTLDRQKAQQEVLDYLRQVSRDPQARQPFLAYWKNQLLGNLGREHDLVTWRHLLNDFRTALRPELSGVVLSDFDALFADVQTLLYDALQMAYAKQRLAEATNAVLISNMVSALSYEAMFGAALNYLKHLRLNRVVLVLYERFGRLPSELARVMFAEGTRSALDRDLFPTARLLPEGMRGELFEGHLMIIPLFTTGAQYGYLIVDQPHGVYFDEETPQHTISRSIRHLEQLHAMRSAHDDLERRVADRTLELQRLNEQLQHDAVHDVLTGLANRALFHDRLRRVVAQAERDSTQGYAVLFLDCDRFKSINDTMGHSVGDDFLIEFAGRLSTSVRPQDTVARFGGDEFAVLLEDVFEAPDVMMIAERIQHTLSEPMDLLGRPFAVTASMGIVTSAGGYSKYEDVLRDADIAMYHSKSLGPGRTTMFEVTMHERVLNRSRLETELRQALSRGGLSVQYQPIVDVQSGTLRGFEALARWVHPVRGFVSPGEFISVAEEAGLVVDLDRFVLFEACDCLRAWREQVPQARDCFLSVNVSTTQFSRADFVHAVQGVLRDTGLCPADVRLEITESLLMQRAPVVQRNLEGLRELGVQLYIDDFGTGYSSLGYLQQFAPSVLKIDRSFVQRVPMHSESAELVRTILSMARNLNIAVVAEGVECQEQWTWLREAGCTYAQGFFFAKPLVPEDALDVLRQNQPLPGTPKEASGMKVSGSGGHGS
ncbi:EAL domain-containing protein [Deinococcus peraridilitoris]|nr:EAL domain-containing protein [Deinococcus peraridilitoris]